MAALSLSCQSMLSLIVDGPGVMQLVECVWILLPNLGGTAGTHLAPIGLPSGASVFLTRNVAFTYQAVHVHLRCSP